MKIPAAYFTRPVGNKALQLNWPEKSVALIPYRKEDATLNDLIKKKIIDVKSIDEFFPVYKGKGKQVFSIVGGGIGDVLAFSSIASYVDLPLTVHTTRKYFPIFKWFKKAVTLKSFYEPIALNYTRENRLIRYRNLERISTEFAAIEAGGKNWYKAFFNRIGIDEVPEGFGRPQLASERQSDSKPLLVKKSVLICHRSSCQMRSSTFRDFYDPIRKAYPKHTIYVHETDLTEDDAHSIPLGVQVLFACSIEQYLLNLYDAAMVVTADSAAIHFREGVGKPALGVYGAMTVESRTHHYKFTKSFNVDSVCPFQPCFIHERIKGQVCTFAEPGDRIAKCQTGESFQGQLYNQLLNY